MSGGLRFLLRSFEKKLYSVSSLLRDYYRLGELLGELEEDFRGLVEASRRPGGLEAMRGFVAEAELLPVVKEVKARFEAVLSSLGRFRGFMDDLELFFERFRDYRYYVLGEDVLPAFLSRLFEGCEEVVFRLLLTGSVLPEEVVERAGGRVLDAFSARVPVSGLPVLVEYAVSRGLGFGVEGCGFQYFYRPGTGFSRVVFGDVSRIPFVDGMVRTLGGSVLNV